MADLVYNVAVKPVLLDIRDQLDRKKLLIRIEHSDDCPGWATPDDWRSPYTADVTFADDSAFAIVEDPASGLDGLDATLRFAATHVFIAAGRRGFVLNLERGKTEARERQKRANPWAVRNFAVAPSSAWSCMGLPPPTQPVSSPEMAR